MLRKFSSPLFDRFKAKHEGETPESKHFLTEQEVSDRFGITVKSAASVMGEVEKSLSYEMGFFGKEHYEEFLTMIYRAMSDTRGT